MPTLTYLSRRDELETYFDRTAVEAWSRLTSDAPVGRIRATVRAGRERMRGTLLDWLPADLSGAKVLDAGCGTGALAFEAARRGAQVVAIDLSPKLVGLARERVPVDLRPGAIEFRSGDMLETVLSGFDYVVAMDSLIHYHAIDMVTTLAGLAARTHTAVLFTFAPRTLPLALMHTIGRLFPRPSRAPSMEPLAEGALRCMISKEPDLRGWRIDRALRISSGFYTSQAMRLTRA